MDADRRPCHRQRQLHLHQAAQLPGQCLASLHLWALDLQGDIPLLVKHVLHEETLVASTVADGFGEVYTDFAVHADGFSRMVLLAGGMAPRRLAVVPRCG